MSRMRIFPSALVALLEVALVLFAWRSGLSSGDLADGQPKIIQQRSTGQQR